MWGLIAGLGLGALKNIEANQQAAEQRKRNAAIQRYSPWTGLQAGQVKDPSLLGDLATGGAIGASGEKMFQGASDAMGKPSEYLSSASEAPSAAGASDAMDPSKYSMGLSGAPSSPLMGSMDSLPFMNQDPNNPMGSWMKLAKNNGMNPYSLYSK